MSICEARVCCCSLVRLVVYLPGFSSRLTPKQAHRPLWTSGDSFWTPSPIPAGLARLCLIPRTSQSSTSLKLSHLTTFTNHPEDYKSLLPERNPTPSWQDFLFLTPRVLDVFHDTAQRGYYKQLGAAISWCVFICFSSVHSSPIGGRFHVLTKKEIPAKTSWTAGSWICGWVYIA